MKFSIIRTALQASLLSLLATKAFAQSATVQTAAATSTLELGPIKTLGCYNAEGPLKSDNTDTFQTSGVCAPKCAAKGFAVMGITGGSTCYCGSELPSLDTQVDASFCNEPCQGYNLQTCGGIGYWQVYLTGLTGDVQIAPNSTTSSTVASAAATSKTPSQIPPAQATVVITASSTPSPTEASSPGPNKVGIAVGVVVGVIALAAIAGGFIFFLKQRRRKEIEEEHKAQAAVNSFVGSSASQKSDARLDPGMASSYRRESIGSIADERDFSRKILQVRNPDRGSMNSAA